MTGSERREAIIKKLRSAEKAIPAKTLAEKYEVSRQVIVQDVALLRVAGYDVISTNRGYILQEKGKKLYRLMKVSHREDQLEDELNTIVDLGGTVKNVIVNHRVYGRMEAELQISSRRDVKEFLNDIESGKSTPLMKITSNYHFHEIQADSEEILKEIEEALKQKGYLLEVMKGEELW